MADEYALAETTISGTATRLPDRVLRELGAEDGDTLRWHVDGDAVRVTVVRQRGVELEEFDGYDGPETTDATKEHDEWGVE